MNKQHHKLIILGSGPAGFTASIYASRANLSPLLITGMVKGGQLTTTWDVENWPGDPEKLTGPILMDRMESHAVKLGTKLITDEIKQVNLQVNPFKLIGDLNEYTCEALIIATGANAKYLGLPSEQKFLHKGVSGCATCDGFFYKNKKVAVIGGGNTAVSEALYLSNIAAHVTLIHRGDKFKAEKTLISQLEHKIKASKVSVKFNTVLNEILGNDQEKVSKINIENLRTNTIEQLDIDGVFIAIGHEPNTKIFKDQLETINGYIKVKMAERMLTQTSIPGIFAAGDVCDPIYRQAITSAASGCMAALDAEKYLENLGNFD